MTVRLFDSQVPREGSLKKGPLLHLQSPHPGRRSQPLFTAPIIHLRAALLPSRPILRRSFFVFASRASNSILAL